MDAIRALGCLCCRIEGRYTGLASEIHHLLDCGRRRGHLFTICLCSWHHRGIVPYGHTERSAIEKFGPAVSHGTKLFRASHGNDDLLLDIQMKLVSPTVYVVLPGLSNYRIGDDGTVWTCLKHNGPNKRHQSDEWQVLSPKVHSRDYLCLSLLCDDGKQRMKYVHRLVLEAYHGPCPDGMESRHLNGDKSDCRAKNLGWGTPAQNAADRISHGTSGKGDNHSQAQLTELQVIELRQRYGRGERICTIARSTGIRYGTIQMALTGKTWKHLEVVGYRSLLKGQ